MTENKSKSAYHLLGRSGLRVSPRPGVGATIIGATKPSQLAENLRALEFSLPPELSSHLERLSRPELVHPYHFFETEFLRTDLLSAGIPVRAEPPWFRGTTR